MSGAVPSRDQQVTDLFAEQYDGMCRLAAHLLGDRAGAEEVVQEAFLRTFSSWRRIRRPQRAQWYLRATVVNLCRSRLRRRATEDRSNRTVYATDPERQATGGSGAGTGAPDDALVVLEAVRHLPTRQRETVILRYYEDLPEAAIAKVLGCSVGTVKSQLSKARATLAAALDGGDPEVGAP